MNRNLLIYLLFCVSVKCEYEINEKEEATVEEQAEGNAMTSVLYKTVNRYYCSFKSVFPPHLIIYGTKSWSFPTQSMNLTLSYPPANVKKELTEKEHDEDDYIITGFSVVLFTDSDGSRGFITNGGILRDHISLTFISSDVSSLSYQFWLYGVTKRTSNLLGWIPLYEHNMCVRT